MSRSTRLSDERFLEALKRIRALIVDGLPLDGEDSTEVGNKYTMCSWGICNCTVEAWPHPDDHLWPDQFIVHQRVAPKYRKKHQLCPFDMSEPNMVSRADYVKGCFWTCKVFNRYGGVRKIPKGAALALYNKRIKQMEERINGKTMGRAD